LPATSRRRTSDAGDASRGYLLQGVPELTRRTAASLRRRPDAFVSTDIDID
jgi:hypothetical protein